MTLEKGLNLFVCLDLWRNLAGARGEKDFGWGWNYREQIESLERWARRQVSDEVECDINFKICDADPEFSYLELYVAQEGVWSFRLMINWDYRDTSWIAWTGWGGNEDSLRGMLKNPTEEGRAGVDFAGYEYYPPLDKMWEIPREEPETWG
jgi:hypothetical protein